MAKLRVGVIGLGMGKGHIRGYQGHPEAEVVAIADLNAVLLEQAGNEFKVPNRYTTAEDMLKKEKLDIVSVATPNKFHAPLTIAALKAGCHVLCEKPMAMNGKEARKMRDTADKVGKRLMINFSYRFTEQSWALKQEVESGILGDIYFARTVWHRRRGMPRFGGWFGQKELSGGGPLIDLGVHRLDLALWLMNYPKPVWVMGSAYNPIATALAKKQNKQYDVEDLAVGMIKFANGATVEVEASWAANCKERERMITQLYGTKGGLVQQNTGEGYNFEAELYLERDGRLFDMALHPPVPGVQGAMAHFVDCILNDKPNTATAEEGIIVMDLLDAIYKSAASGQPVKVG
ncbi:MAG: dehydrogenase [Lentisphaerae bacterium RIFOXYB12_FULL_65_16]|nr:MAG: dehydrogenase [Lentisphaerae bacterium RIFOXYA12_64_32]OGV92804.1 MAG: dehydrogenase [Lentisphaerae bacterium RIFOXYB12_FULL_65_16]